MLQMNFTLRSKSTRKRQNDRCILPCSPWRHPGGYYVSAGCDKIIANRNCWTGSIGVTLGTMYDVSELLDNLGIKTQTITSGANKAMGSSVEPMTKEQKQIYQSMVAEAYEQFTEIVAEGRNMSLSKVKKLADRAGLIQQNRRKRMA